ncbi:hypothetical protein HKI87_02g17270 [Chloropicon roscoffensis]|uniref:Uncharacterized protein n=1 Tax=Chloropicon roscoffensis TaxID=1461544 RepID=A0AAX4P2B0_9CHLO
MFEPLEVEKALDRREREPAPMGFDRARSRSRSPAGYEREDGEVTPEGSDHAEAEDLLLGPEERERRERDLIERRRRERAAILERHNKRKEFEITQASQGRLG